jgi:hypothetical protein
MVVGRLAEISPEHWVTLYYSISSRNKMATEESPPETKWRDRRVSLPGLYYIYYRLL